MNIKCPNPNTHRCTKRLKSIMHLCLFYQLVEGNYIRIKKKINYHMKKLHLVDTDVKGWIKPSLYLKFSYLLHKTRRVRSYTEVTL